ncbi:unnamed protein product [Phytomonas sp. Hart1]|nr:unnamed protein product [Phytomonas sp. Hart1]|eukprot:CCW66742.1 unnamed protein product [Phytomonas sp. isolate Hart1]
MASLKYSLQQQCKSDISKACLRRSLFVGLISTLFIFLWLFYANELNQIPFSPSVLSKDDRQDIFVRTTGPRVVIFVISDKIDDALCYSVGSAYLTGLPVVVAGYKMKYNGFLSKFNFLGTAIDNAELDPEDVVILMDSDTIFTGVDIHTFIDRFITKSAATPEELDALAVRQDRAMAPFIASAEAGCWAGNVFESHMSCKFGYEDYYGNVRRFSAAHPEHKLVLPFDISSRRYLNAGVLISRVWAYREFLQKADILIRTMTPRYRLQLGWYCDQSVYAWLYLSLLEWEVEQNVFSLPLHERQAARSTYGVRAGFIGLDYANELSAPTTMFVIHLTEMHDRHWGKYLPLYGIGHPHSQKIINIEVIFQFVSDLYKRAYAAHGEEIYTKLAVPKWVAGKRTSAMTSISLTPPLLATNLNPIDAINNDVRRTFPVIYHAAGDEPGLTKVAKLEYGAVGAQWLVPMVHNPKIEKEIMEYLTSMPLFLSTNNSIIQDSYHNKCGFPFKKTLKKVKNL